MHGIMLQENQLRHLIENDQRSSHVHMLAARSGPATSKKHRDAEEAASSPQKGSSPRKTKLPTKKEFEEYMNDEDARMQTREAATKKAISTQKILDKMGPWNYNPHRGNDTSPPAKRKKLPPVRTEGRRATRPADTSQATSSPNSPSSPKPPYAEVHSRNAADRRETKAAPGKPQRSPSKGLQPEA